MTVLSRGAIPTGTVTFLFTDIENSTGLLERLGADYASLLDKHRRLLRAAFEHWEGFEIDTQGDSFFVAFPRASAALRSAVEAQRAIGAESWPSGTTVRVRIGLHTGEPLVAASVGYVGMDVHLAARIGNAAHGGQIVVSDTAREALTADLPGDIELLPLGEHELKGVRGRVALYQVKATGLPEAFPPLRTLIEGDEPPSPGEPPFKGLEYFDVVDAPLFFGRERLTNELVRRLSSTSFLALVGASGSGKSSIVRAGIIPALARKRSPEWSIQVLTPGSNPLQALSITQDAQGPAARRLLVMDQFEEVFTLGRDERERDEFIGELLKLVRSHRHTTLLLTLRADFYDRIAAYHDLREAVADSQDYIGPMTREELRRAVEGPAAAGNWQFSPGLVDLILHDVGEEPGSLPLLSHALLETWRHRRRNVMTLKSYAESGGVRAAIARTAERVFNAELDEQERELAKSIFLRLTELGEGAQDTRRRVALGELMPRADSAATRTRAVLGRLADARLVTVGQESAEVAHEALIREWPRLRDWLSEDREALRVHRQLTIAEQEWDLLERDRDALYRGARLARALDWAGQHSGAMNEREQAFLDASQDEQVREETEREAQRQRELDAAQHLASSERSAARRLRRRALLLLGALVLTGIAAVTAVFLGIQAEAARRTADSQRLAAESNNLLNLSSSSELAALLALRGLDSAYTPQADMALQRASRRDYGTFLLSAERQVDAVAASPDGGAVATLSRDAIVHIWSAGTGQQVRDIQLSGISPVGSGAIQFSPDGQRLAVFGTQLNDGTHRVTVWDPRTGDSVMSVDEGLAGTYSPDGSEIFLRLPQQVVVIDATSGQTKRAITVGASTVSSRIAAIDGSHVEVAEGNDAVTYDLSSGQPVLNLASPSPVTALAVSPDGRLVGTAAGNTASIWDLTTGQLLRTLVGHTEQLFAVAFSPDSRYLLSGSLDNTARMWDIETGQELRRLSGHTAAVYDVAIAPDGGHAITASADKSARIWDLSRPVEADTVSSGVSSPVYGISFSPDGRTMFTTGGGVGDAKGTIWDTTTLEAFQTVPTGSRVDRAAFSPDGLLLLLSPDFDPPQLWDVASGASLGPLTGSPPQSGDWGFADFSADASLMLAVASDGTAAQNRVVGLWDASSRQLLRTFGDPNPSTAALSPSGAYVAVGYERPTDNLVVFDSHTGEKLHSLNDGLSVVRVVFAPDGQHVLTGNRDNIARIVDINTGEAQELVGHTNIVWGAAFSPDGRFALTGSQDRTARLWDVGSGAEVRRFASHADTAIAGVAFSPDGRTVAIGSFDGYTQLTPVDLSALQDTVCGRVLRDLSPAERDVYEIHDAAPTCTQTIPPT